MLIPKEKIVNALAKGSKTAIELCRYFNPEIDIVDIVDARCVRETCRMLVADGLITIQSEYQNRAYPPYNLSKTKTCVIDYCCKTTKRSS
jgi:hypothetical protein